VNVRSVVIDGKFEQRAKVHDCPYPA
jgi:hypothetical protein